MSPRVAAWMRFGGAAIAGFLAAYGQEPYYAYFSGPLLMFAAFAVTVVLYAQTSGKWAAAGIGWVFGFAYFLHGWFWLLSPFQVDVERDGWMAPFALVLLCAGLALYWGLAFGVARWLSRRTWPLIFCLPAAEMMRGYFFTGFPWGTFSQGLINLWPGQGLAFGGPHMMTLIFVAAAAGVTGFRRASPALRGAKAVLAALVLAGLTVPFTAPETALTDTTVRMIQPNAAQKDKWDSQMIPIFFDRQLAFTSAMPAAGDPAPDLILWSETAIPWPLDLAQGAMDQIALAADGTPVVLGLQRRTEVRYFNSAILLGADGRISDTYDKHHLVPFGEYMPFGDALAKLGIHGLAAQDGNGYSSGPGAALMDLGPLGTALPLICYEAVFARDVNAAPERPRFLMQLTNDAWFGKGQGPLQHLAQARMRAIEQGLPMARVANTGVSAMIDPRGRITASLGLNKAGFLDARLPQSLPPTLYSRIGEWPFLILLLIGLGAALVMRQRHITFDAPQAAR